MNLYLPMAKIGASTIEANSPGDGKNYFLLANITNTTGVGSNGTGLNPLSGRDAQQMDSKIDDGMPGTGTIIAIDATQDLNSYSAWTTVSGVNACVVSSAYALNPGTTPSCSLRFKFN